MIDTLFSIGWYGNNYITAELQTANHFSTRSVNGITSRRTKLLKLKLRIKLSFFFKYYWALFISSLYVTEFRDYDLEIQKTDYCEITSFRYHNHWSEYQICNIVSILFYHNEEHFLF